MDWIWKMLKFVN